MNADKQGEILSALMDGESTELELRQLLAGLDDASAERWSRWHLVQDVMQKHATLPQRDTDFCHRIQAAIAAEGAAPLRQRRWVGSLSRVAVAASVALAVVAGWQLWQAGGNQLGDQQLATAPGTHQAMPVSDDFRMVAPEVRYSYPQQSFSEVQPVADTFTISREQFNRMMARHGQLATQQTKLSPYAQMVDFNGRADQ